MSVLSRSYQFRSPWWGIVLFVLGVALTLRLGIWQLNRANEKTLILKQSQSRASSINLNQLTVPPRPYQPLKAEGHYLNQKTVLLDNQFYRHQPGYFVLTPFKLNSGQLVLVNRGWTKKGSPVSLKDNKEMSLEGSAYYPSSKQWLLGPFLSNKESSFQVIEALKLTPIEELLKLKLEPFVFRLSSTSGGAFIKDWPEAYMTPERHLGYALQWFSFAVVIFIIFLRFTVRRVEQDLIAA